MREFLISFFETREEPFDVTLFSIWHFMFITVILTAIIVSAIYLSKKDDIKKQKALNFIAYAIVIIYIADFFIQPLFRNGEMNVDKLPFHICTFLCPVIAFTQFNKKFAGIKEPVALLSIISPLVYVIYPGSALGTESPFCYEIIQTFTYHGLVLTYGVLMLTTRTVVPSIRKAYKAFIFICVVALWSSFGNLAYSEGGWGDGYDWFFITGSTFDFVPTVLMPFIMVFGTFGVVMLVYGVYYLVSHLLNRETQINKSCKSTEKIPF